MSVAWTKEQQSAIDCPVGKGDILVSAAAGSGKTAVLVERILKNIINDKIDIDKFLVVTFTKAAAAGMKQKIRKALSKKLDEAYAEHNEEMTDFLKRQIDLVSSADITTIDAFCLSVVKNNFHYLGIDPNFKNIDQEEDDMICDNVIDALFERLYDEHDERFLNLVENFASYRNDYTLIAIVKKIYKFTENFSKPQEWLEEKAKMYDEDMSQSEWTSKYFLDDIKRHGLIFASKAKALLNSMAAYSSDDSINDYFSNENEVYPLIKEKCDCQISSVNTLKNIYNFGIELSYKEEPFGILADDIPASDFPPKKLPKWEEENKQFFDKARELINEIRVFVKTKGFKDIDELNAKWHAKELSDFVRDICYLLKLFRNEVYNEKVKKSSWSFSDIEHMAFDLFDQNEPIRKNYTKKYREILIDEYQDTNDLQDGIFRKISHNKRNIFMVGDLKQSIYGFRGGDPYIFKKRSSEYEFYELGKNEDKKIILSRNFRSRPEVLDSVNEIFYSIMSDSVGDVEYNDSQSLNYEYDLPEQEDDEISYKSEFHMILDNDVKQTDKITCEAIHVAKEIKKLIGKKYYDEKQKKYVKIRYKDITVLTRSVTGVAEEFAKVFSQYSIPIFIETGDYFKRREISTMMSLLSVIANHKQDIPLISTMRSPVFGFSYDELAILRIEYGKYEKDGEIYKRRYFYDCVKAASDTESELGVKCKNLVHSLDKWRDFTRKRKVSELIWTIFEETAFYDFMGALEGGTEAQSNLRLLYERAKKFEAEGFCGLFSFINYIERVKASDQNSAALSGADSVTMTTSHKSKGLEYPVVFLVGAGKSFSSGGKTEPVMLHKDLGLGVMYPDAVLDCLEHTFGYDYIKEVKRVEGISELMRLFYVAITRPQYKLYVVGTLNPARDDVNKYKSINIDEEYVKSSNGIYQWMLPVMKNSKHWDYFEFEYDGDVEAEEEYTENEEQEFDEEEYAKLLGEIDLLLGRRYKYADISMIPSRTTATELKKLQQEEDADSLLERKSSKKGMKHREFSLIEKPDFVSGDIKGAMVGTAYHQIMAYIDLEKIKNNLSEEVIGEEIKRILENGNVDGRVVEKTGGKMVSDIYKFFKSELGKKMLNSKELYREQSFQTYVNAEVYNSSLDKETANEKIILQGIIDCMIKDEDGNYILLDYKTDNCTQKNYHEIIEKYRIQLDLYSYAIEKIMGIKVHKKYLYLFHIAKCAEL